MRRLISSGSPFEAEAGYSRAVADGEFVFVAGTTGFDYARMTISAEQARRALRNIEAALAEAGASLADALEKARSADRPKIIAALEASTFAGHVMPYGPTKFVNGQNQGAAPANTQVLDNDIKVVLPANFAQAKPVFPIPA